MPSFFQKGYSTSPAGLKLQKSMGYANAGIQAFNILNAAYGATNKTGNALSSIGGVMGSIPTLPTKFLGTGLGVAGAITNAFTDTVNEDYVKQIGSQISNLAKTTSNAGDISTLQQSYRDLASSNVELGDISNWGSVGMFGSGRKRKNARETAAIALETAKTAALGNLNQQGRNINQTNFTNQYSQLLAFGGPITGAIDYTNMMDYTALKKKQIDKGLQYAKGGGIYIKPSKRGTFTAAATKHGMGVQEFASRVLANKEDYSPAMIKKANFARNARNWKHEDGGWLEELNNNPLFNIVKFVDPTGVSSYYDVYDAGKDLYNNPSWSNAGALGIEVLGALPLVGKLKKAVELGSMINKGDKTFKAGAKTMDYLVSRFPAALKDGYDMQKYEESKKSKNNKKTK